MVHPADETLKDKLLYGGVPAAISLLLLIVAISIDLSDPGMHWTARVGTIVLVLGGYVAYVDAKKSHKFIDGSMYMNFELPYRPIAFVMVTVGTLLAGFGDLLL